MGALLFRAPPCAEGDSLLPTSSESGQNFIDEISVFLLNAFHIFFFFLSRFALGLEQWLGDSLTECRIFSFASAGTKALKPQP